MKKAVEGVYMDRGNLVPRASYLFDIGKKGKKPWERGWNLGSQKKDQSSVRWSSAKAIKSGKARRKRLRGVKNGVSDLHKETETESYVSGVF